MQLVGREKELEVIDTAIAAVRDGDSRTVAIVGEAGIGKSALLATLAREAAGAGMTVLAGRAAEHERDVPFGLVVDAFDDHVATMGRPRLDAVGPELGAVLPSAATGDEPVLSAAAPAERFRLHRALRALLELLGRERPVALALDDLHWADDASLELVLHLLRRPPRAPVLLVLAARPGSVAARLLDAARSVNGFAHVPLGTLGHEASLSLLDGLPGDVRERLAGEAGGNPLFLQELARLAPGADDPLPATVLAAVQAEVAGAPAAARTLLDGAAIAGDPFDLDVAAEAAGIEPREALGLLDHLVAADLVRPTAGARTFAFRHPLVRRAVDEALPPGRRLAAHERAAAALAARGASPAQRAFHVEHAARPGDAGCVALLADAAAASSASSPATAARWWAAALRLVPFDDTARRAELTEPLARSLADAGRLEDAVEAYAAAVELHGDRAGRAELVAELALLEQQLGRVAEAERRLTAALDDAPPDLAPLLALALGTAGFYGGDPAAMAHWGARVLELAPAEDAGLRTAGRALQALGRQWGGDPGGAAPLLDEATARFARLSDAEVAGRLDVALILALGQLLGERFTDVIVTTERAVAAGGATGRGSGLSGIAHMRSLAAQSVLDLEDALRWSETAEEAARLQGARAQEASALWLRAVLHEQRGERAEAAATADAARAALPAIGSAQLAALAAGSLATIGAEEDPAGAVRAMTAPGAMFHADAPAWTTWQLVVLVRSAVAADQLDDVRDVAARAAERADRLGLAASRAWAATARGEIELADGDARAAVASGREALELAEAVGNRHAQVVARLLLGRALAEAGERDEGVEQLRRAATDAAREHRIKLRDAASRELRRLGSRMPAAGRRAARPEGADALTPRERDIAQLVAQGRTNKEVAATLFLSEKTIEHHLSRVYAKVGVRSRVELARALGDAL